jgi:hypothetical protein
VVLHLLYGMTLIVAVNEVGDGIIALANCCGLSLASNKAEA